MVAGAAWLLVGVVVAVGAGLLLYGLVRAEHDRRVIVGREAAERRARRDVPDDERAE